MCVIDIYARTIDCTGRHGAASERDDDTAFFYLLELDASGAHKIREVFNAHTVTAMPANAPVALRWDSAGDAVGLFVGYKLIAVFDLRSEGQMGRWASDEDKRLFTLQ